MNLKKIALFSAILIVIEILQSTFGPYIEFFKVKPDIAMIILIFISSQTGSVVSMYIGFFAGLSFDLLTGSPLGLFSFIFTVLAYIFGLGKGNVYYDPILIPMLVTLAGTILKYVLFFIIGFIFNLQLQFPFHSGFIVEILYNAILAVPLFFLVMTIKRKFSRPGVGFNG